MWDSSSETKSNIWDSSRSKGEEEKEDLEQGLEEDPKKKLENLKNVGTFATSSVRDLSSTLNSSFETLRY